MNGLRFAARLGRLLCLGLLAGALGCLSAGPRRIAADRNLRWQRGDNFVELRAGDWTIWRFTARPDHGKPHFDAVALPGMPSLVWPMPPDHPWHYGLWHSWKLINGVNYWEENKATHQAAGETAWHDVTYDLRDDHSARITMTLSYAPRGTAGGAPGGAARAILRERREIDISAPAADGSYAIDWTMALTAGGEDVTLDRTPIAGQPGGQPNGGYAGLSARLSPRLAAGAIAATADTGPMASNRYHFRAAAADINGIINGRPVGMAMLNHPANPNSPSPWYAIVDPRVPFYYLNAAFIYFGPHRLPAGQSLTLRYRVLVHPDRWDGARLERELARYRDGH